MKVYILGLCHVQGSSDEPVAVAISDSLDRLQDWEKEQRATIPYTIEASKDRQDRFGQIHNYNLVYKEGSPLQWYNGLGNPWGPDPFGGIWIGESDKDTWREVQPNAGMIKV